MTTCLRWILEYMRLEIWCKIGLSADWCLCTALCTHSGACYCSRLTVFFPGLPGSAGTRKVKLIWTLQKQETVSGSGISWAICKSASHSRQITTPTPHHSVFYSPDALPAAQPTVSKTEGKQCATNWFIFIIHLCQLCDVSIVWCVNIHKLHEDCRNFHAVSTVYAGFPENTQMHAHLAATCQL